VVINVSIRIEINIPASAAYAYIADFSNNAAWQSGIKSTDWTSPPPIRVGSTYDQISEYKGIVTGYEITTIDPSRSITTESRDGATFPITVTRSVVPLGEARCRVTVDLAGYPRGFRRFAKPLVVKIVRDTIETDYRRLKRLLEGGEEG
jgi:uncharacterized membrane protein